MSILIYGFALLFAAFFVHLCVWKIRLPQNHTKSLLLIFSGTLVLGLSAFLKIFPTPSLSDSLQLIFFFVSFTLAYIVTYSAIEVDSPSVIIIKAITSTKQAGLPKEQIEHHMDDKALVIPRIKDLLPGKAAVLNGNKYQLTPLGVITAKVFRIYRSLLKKDIKGG